MGCDFFFKGNLPDVGLQEKVINFVKEYFDKIDLEISPNTALNYSTEIILPRKWPQYDPRSEQYDEYSYNYFGIVTDCKDEYGINDAGQFIFNRNDKGRLVTIMRLPESFVILPHRYYQEEMAIEYSKPDTVPELPGILLTKEEMQIE